METEVLCDMKQTIVACALLLMLTAPVLSASSPNFSDKFRQWKADAECGDARAQYFLGLAFVIGRGTYPNYTTALMWFTIAAARGEPNAVASRERIARRMKADQRRISERMARDWLRTHRAAKC